jgi:hypothetical protein
MNVRLCRCGIGGIAKYEPGPRSKPPSCSARIPPELPKFSGKIDSIVGYLDSSSCGAQSFNYEFDYFMLQAKYSGCV